MKKTVWILSSVAAVLLIVVGVMGYFYIIGDLCLHDYAAASCTEAKTCQKCGKVKGVAMGHDWQESTCEAPQSCKRCSLTQGEALGHSWLARTCELPKRCRNCEATQGEAKGHNWKAATCTSAKTCLTCRATEGNPKGHFALVKATCTEKEVCSRCKQVVKNALGHSWTAASCTEPSTCTRCEATTGNPKGHSYKGVECQRCHDENPKFIACSQLGDNIYYKVIAIPNSGAAFTSLDWEMSGTTLTIQLSGKKTFDIWGKNNNDPFRCVWKLYDAKGYIIDSGEIKTEDLVKGDRFTQKLVIKNIDKTQTYQLKFYDYEVLD